MGLVILFVSIVIEQQEEKNLNQYMLEKPGI